MLSVSVFPSPQLIVYLFGLPSALVVKVIDNGDPPATESDVKSTLATAVFFNKLRVNSFKSSIAFTILVELVIPRTPLCAPSSGSPNADCPGSIPDKLEPSP